MMSDVPSKPWLPAHCLTAKRAAEPFERVIREWAETWFKGASWQVLGTWDAISQPDSSEWSVLRDADSLRIKGRPKAAQALALAMLGQTEQPKYTPQDLRLMRRLASKALDDLQVAIEQALGTRGSGQTDAGATPNDGQRYSLLIGVIGGAELAIECSAADLVRIVRGTFPRLLKAVPLADRIDAVADETVEFAASLGSATFSVEEFSKLEAGDILILDKDADAPAQLSLAGHPTELPVTIGEANGKTTFELQELT